MTPPALDRKFAEKLLRAFDDPQEYGVHRLFNAWWRYAPEEVKQAYLADFERIPGTQAFVEEQFYADPLSLETLATLPDGSLGRAYHDFLVENGLEKNLAMNYRRFHRFLSMAGRLRGMPKPLEYAVLRGFQIHDFLHVLTGYDSSQKSELALQAFCLAQLRFPYFAMWMSVVTTRMTFLDPGTIAPVMDAISGGWQFGRAVPCLQLEKWETLLDVPLDALRARYGIAPEGLSPARSQEHAA